MKSTVTELLRQCDGIEGKMVEPTMLSGANKIEQFFKTKDVVIVPDNIFVEVISTSTRGTIGKLVDIEFNTFGDNNKISTYTIRYIIEIEGRKKTSRITNKHGILLKHHDGTTKWVRNVKTHPKKVIKNPVNKYKQELQKGDWIIGATSGRGIEIGQITRWTNHNVWAVPYGAELDNKENEFKLDSINQTFLLPNDDHLQSLTIAILKGYDGY